MSAFLMSLIIAGGLGVWIYGKLQNHSGNNTKQSLTASGVAASLIFIVLIVILKSIL